MLTFCRIRTLFPLFIFAMVQYAIAQSLPPSMYEQASELSGYVIQHEEDIHAVKDFYTPYNLNNKGEEQGKSAVLNSPEERKRIVEIENDYLNRLKNTDFNSMSIYGKVDYVLLKKEIVFNLGALKKEEENYQKITKYVPFADTVYLLEKKRRRGNYLDAQAVSAQLSAISRDVKTLSAEIKKTGYIEEPFATLTQSAVKGLQMRLKNTFDFYNGYDPQFTWWVPKPYQQLDSALTTYTALIKSKAKIISSQKPDSSGIKGIPIGRDELIRQLQAEMIPYTPEELIVLANKEFAWCDKEMLKASEEMGTGKNWKAALEKVKNSYVPVGHQPELIVKLYNDALDFIKSKDLITIPPLADETWGMIMMTPERQLVNPFFTGGREISISYPTNTMAEEDRLMSMRGNNPYFSRGTVQHELIPGHNLQYFMNSRYRPYRESFQTPFAIEGWSLYWELLLYDQGFAKTPEERIGMLFWRMHRCARIIFSLNYHLGNWTPQQCIDFLVDRVGHEKANAEGEVRRSFATSYSPLYQVAYLTGGLQLWGLKKELVDSGKMTFKQFHDAVIKQNLIPIEMVRATLINQPLTPDFTTSWKFYDFNNNNGSANKNTPPN